MRTVTSEGWDEQSSPELNDDDLNTPSARASFANFDENLKGDQIELKYFLSFSDQFNSFQVLKRQKQGGNGSATGTRAACSTWHVAPRAWQPSPQRPADAGAVSLLAITRTSSGNA